MDIFLDSCYLLFGIQQAVALGALTRTSFYRFTHHKGLAKGIFWTRGSTLCIIRGLQFATALLICFDFELIQNEVLLFSLQSRQKHDCFGQFCVIGKNLKLSFRVEQLAPSPESELNCNAIFLQKADSSTFSLIYVWQMPIAWKKKKDHNWHGEVPQGGYPEFQVAGMIEGFFGARKFGKYFLGCLDLSRKFLGLKQSEGF